MPVLVSNQETGPTVFSDLSENIAVEWAGKGDPAGEDVQYVPDKALENVSFMKAIQHGILKVEQATDEIKARLEAQVEAVQARRAASRQASADVMDTDSEQPIATAQVDESTGKVTHIVTQTDEIDPNTGKAKEASIPVVIGPREKH